MLKQSVDFLWISPRPTAELSFCPPLFLFRRFPALDFLHEAKESGVFELYYIELVTGLRRGELLGLKWEDIDLEGGTIQVRRQIA